MCVRFYCICKVKGNKILRRVQYCRRTQFNDLQDQNILQNVPLYAHILQFRATTSSGQMDAVKLPFISRSTAVWYMFTILQHCTTLFYFGIDFHGHCSGKSWRIILSPSNTIEWVSLHLNLPVPSRFLLISSYAGLCTSKGNGPHNKELLPTRKTVLYTFRNRNLSDLGSLSFCNCVHMAFET